MNPHPPAQPPVIGPTHLARLRAAAGGGPVLIHTHDNPDPDGLAAGAALRALLAAWAIPSRLVYGGLIARAENRAMLERLTPHWEQSDTLTGLAAYSAVALVDTQPGAGNNSLPPGHVPDIVLDHHQPVRELIATVRYADVRPDAGATVTMLYQYLEAAKITPDPLLATAMFYGLKTDTRGLSRGTSPQDEAVYLKLLARARRDLLIQVEQAGLAPDYFRSYSRGLNTTRIYGRAVVARLGPMHQPDMAAEMADLLIRLEQAEAVLCLGQFEDTLHLSLRTKPLTENAGALIQQIVAPPGKGGGHRSMAGGQVPLGGGAAEPVMDHIEARFLAAMGEAGPGAPLLQE